MHINELTGKNVCILGYGKEGQAMVETIEKCGIECEIVISDENKELRITNYELRTGKDYLKDLDDFDVIIKSPGILPSCLPLTANRLPLTNSTQIFLDTIAKTSASVIGVTGSKGKSTTASLIHAMLKEVGKESYLVGNIGNPAISHLSPRSRDSKIAEHRPQRFSNRCYVCEMSSYQLMDLTISPPIALITSFFPEHLDYHRDLERYKDAKKNITRFQTEDDIVFYYEPSDGACDIAKESKGKQVPYTMDDSPIAIIDTPLKGTHNLANVAGAWKVSQHLGISKEVAINAIQNFTPLPHRLQSLGIHNWIEWIDDSISTTPNSTIAAIDALDGKIGALILGGQDRGADYTLLAKKIEESEIENVIVMGEAGERIQNILNGFGIGDRVRHDENMKMAVEYIKKKNRIPNTEYRIPIVLLSPAAPSYDQFKNFEEKGDEFKNCIIY